MATADDKSSTNDQIGLWEKWRALLDRERDQRERLLETLETGGQEHRVALREWWGTVSEVLKGVKNVTHLDALPPREFFAVLAEQADCLAVGQIPNPIKHAGWKGRKAPGPGELRDIRWAVTYVGAVKDGRVQGRRPVAVVRRLYKLRDERTVRAWCREHNPFPHLETWTVSSLRGFLIGAAHRYRQANARTWARSGSRKAEFK